MDELSFALYLPLLVLALIALILFIAAQVMGSRDGGALSSRLLDLTFGLALLGGAYVIVLLLISLISEPDVIYDIVVIMLIVGIFFAVVLFVLFGVFELIFSRGGGKSAAQKSD